MLADLNHILQAPILTFCRPCHPIKYFPRIWPMLTTITSLSQKKKPFVPLAEVRIPLLSARLGNREALQREGWQLLFSCRVPPTTPPLLDCLSLSPRPPFLDLFCFLCSAGFQLDSPKGWLCLGAVRRVGDSWGFFSQETEIPWFLSLHFVRYCKTQISGQNQRKQQFGT